MRPCRQLRGKSFASHIPSPNRAAQAGPGAVRRRNEHVKVAEGDLDVARTRETGYNVPGIFSKPIKGAAAETTAKKSEWREGSF
jgi:hypothetical protein